MNKKRVLIKVYVPQDLRIAYNPDTGEAHASMTFRMIRQKKKGRDGHPNSRKPLSSFSSMKSLG
jgi:hypothetical protein